MRNYINISKYGNSIYHKYVDDDNIRREEYEDFQPSLFFRSDDYDKEAEYRSLIHGYPLKRKIYPSLNEHYSAEKRYKDLGSLVFGDIGPQYQFITENYEESKSFDVRKMRIFYFDIETAFEPGVFPEPETADYEILTISIYDSLKNKFYLLGSKECNLDFSKFKYKSTDEDDNVQENNLRAEVQYEYYEKEKHLLSRFIELWTDDLYPDMVVGWNSEKFDIPYTYQRITKVLGSTYARKLSPFKRTISRMKKEEIKPGWIDEFLHITINGINTIDMMKFYKKNILDPRRSYSLDEIAQVEIGANKLTHNYSNLMELYENDYDTFCAYNLMDVELMIGINVRVRLLELIVGQAYMAGVNFEDTYSPNKRWDAKLYRRLLHEKIVLEPRMLHDSRPPGHGISEPKLKSFIDRFDTILEDIKNTWITSVEDPKKINKPSTGGFVMTPSPGLHKNVASFDLNSLYPFIMCLLGLGVESAYIPGVYEPGPIKKLIEDKYDGNEERFLNEGCTMAPNGVYFAKDIESSFVKILLEHYKLRASIRKEVAEKKELLKKVKNEIRSRTKTA